MNHTFPNDVVSSAEVDRLTALANELGIVEGVLDETVIDLACSAGCTAANEFSDEKEQDDFAISDAEREASNINNEGIRGQVEFLLRVNFKDAEGIIRAVAAECTRSAVAG